VDFYRRTHGVFLNRESQVRFLPGAPRRNRRGTVESDLSTLDEVGTVKVTR